MLNYKDLGDYMNSNQEIISKKHLQLEIEKIINLKLYNKGIIEQTVYDDVNNMLLSQISKEIENGTL